MINDFIIDFETFGNRSNAAVIDLSTICFNPDPNVVETLDELISKGRRWKFDLKSQQGKRVFGVSTMNWWKDQSPEARENLKPTDADVSVTAGITDFLLFLRENNVNGWESFGWCRGQSFDFPILVDCICQIKREAGEEERDIDTFKAEPCKFWNQRDLRTAIESLALTRGLTTTPLPLGTLNGFIAHDSLHDCAKDVLMLKYAQRYALGLEEVPSKENTDPLSLPKSRK